MKNIVFLIAFFASLFLSVESYAAQLFMIHNPNCSYCMMFMNDVYPTYNQTEQSRLLPLSILNITDPVILDWIKDQVSSGNMKALFGTPTFIIWDNDKELDRIVSYGGKESFYRQLDEVIQKHGEIR